MGALISSVPRLVSVIGITTMWTPTERHQARMAAIYVDITDDERDWDRPCTMDRDAAYQEINHAMNDYRMRMGDLNTPQILRIKDAELEAALQAWPDRPVLVGLAPLRMDGHDIYV
jgi:hypothetical protein